MDPLEANNKADVDCDALNNIKSEKTWEDLIEVYRQNVEQETLQTAGDPSDGHCSWTVDESTSNHEVTSHPVIVEGAEINAKLNSTVEMKQEEMSISDEEDNDELKYVPIKAEDIVTSFQSPEGYVDCQDFNNLSSEEYNGSIIKNEAIIEDEETEYDDDEDSDNDGGNDNDDDDDNDLSDEDYLIEYDCKECGLTFQTEKKFEAHYKKCKKLYGLYEQLEDDPQKVKCLTCEQIVAFQRISEHNKYYHAKMVQLLVCPSKSNCPYVSVNKCNMFLHVSRRHSNENISRTTKLKKKLMPNPRVNPNLYALNKTKNFHAKFSPCKGDKVRVFECPSETCNFFSKAKRNVRSHILTHKKDVDSEDFAKLASKSIQTIFIPEELYKSQCLSNPPTNHFQMQDKGGEAKKRKRSLFYKTDIWCCGKAFSHKTRMFEHRKFVHRTHINLYYCPVDGCTVTNLRQHKIRSHIMVVHAKRLEAREIENFLLPEKIKCQEIPNPNYVPLVEGTENGQIKEEPDASVEGECSSVGDGVKKSGFQCNDCRKTFKNKVTLRGHRREHHDQNKKQKCLVAECTYETRRFYNLKEHIERHVNRKDISQKEMNDIVKKLRRK